MHRWLHLLEKEAMTKGLVIGKFLPFHKGHQALIEFGANQCDELIVLVCASNKEHISGTVRENWISETFKDSSKIKVLAFHYDESDLPNTSNSSKEISNVWAKEFAKLLPDVTILFSSEPYGNYVSEFMGIDHIMFDEKRTKNPISGSILRESPYENWAYLPDIVKLYFQKKIVILGTESVGKSTLAAYLTNQFSSVLVHEIGRDIIPDSKCFTEEQLKQIAEAHAVNINDAVQSLCPLVIIDTDIHITQSYAKHTFGSYLELSGWIYDYNQADLYLYLVKEVPFIQDGSRLDENERNELDRSHRDTLAYFGIEFEELPGSYETRNSIAYQLVSELVNRFK
tara:strand:+ start:2518 stop:3540 length:1023 start_codon:yes stop_codon:yes gene_type:complete